MSGLASIGAMGCLEVMLCSERLVEVMGKVMKHMVASYEVAIQ